jgi:hypothetical protein
MTFTKVCSIAIAITLLTWGNAFAAQPTDDEDIADPSADDENPLNADASADAKVDEEKEVVVEKEPAKLWKDDKAEAKTAARATTETAADPATDRPVGLSLGIGFGYVMPTAIDQPNTASARFRLAGGIILEPRIELETSSQSFESGGADSSDGQYNVTLATSVLYPLRSRGAFDLLVIGAAWVQTTGEDPDGDDNNRTDTTLGVGWGLGINYWLTQHWSLSFMATNPLFSYSTSTQEGVVDDTTSSTTFIGADFDPAIITMIHLYY